MCVSGAHGGEASREGRLLQRLHVPLDNFQPWRVLVRARGRRERMSDVYRAGSSVGCVVWCDAHGQFFAGICERGMRPEADVSRPRSPGVVAFLCTRFYAWMKSKLRLRPTSVLVSQNTIFIRCGRGLVLLLRRQCACSPKHSLGLELYSSTPHAMPVVTVSRTRVLWQTLHLDHCSCDTSTAVNTPWI